MNARTVHASAVLFGERGVLIRGPSGSGKSSLVLRLLDRESPPAWLISDDQVILTACHGRLIAQAPPTIAGRIEVRGLGIRRLDFNATAVVHLVVDLVSREQAPRLPEPHQESTEIDGIRLPLLMIAAGDDAAADRIRAKFVFGVDDGFL